MTEAIVRLVYRSRNALQGTVEECLAEVSEILRVSRANNRRTGLTGVLLFDGTTFLQAVEGPIAAIERLYETIACDQRHEDITLIDLVDIEAREYDAWDMAFLDGTEASQPLLRRFMTTQFDPNAAWSGSALSVAMKALLA